MHIFCGTPCLCPALILAFSLLSCTCSQLMPLSALQKMRSIPTLLSAVAVICWHWPLLLDSRTEKEELSVAVQKSRAQFLPFMPAPHCTSTLSSSPRPLPHVCILQKFAFSWFPHSWWLSKCPYDYRFFWSLTITDLLPPYWQNLWKISISEFILLSVLSLNKIKKKVMVFMYNLW